MNDPELQRRSATNNNWKLVYAVFALIGVAALILIYLYREAPKRTGIVQQKRKTPATQGVFVALLSPLDTITARKATAVITDEFEQDSATTDMVVGGTHIYKRCTSLADYRTLLVSGMVNARDERLEIQGKLLSQVAAAIFSSDTLPSTLYCVGALSEGDYQDIQNRMEGIANILYTRHHAKGPLHIKTYFMPSTETSGDSAQQLHALFFDAFRSRGLNIEDRSNDITRHANVP